jgi:hypothetical protein
MPTDQMVLRRYFQKNEESVEIVHDFFIEGSSYNILAKVPLFIVSFDEHPR